MIKVPGKNDKTRHYWLRLAKQERAHAKDNLKKKKQEGNDHAVNVYQCRIKALDLYIKILEKQSVA